MTTKAREFIEFWIETSVHAAEPLRVAGASQDVVELTRRCIDAANDLGISEKDLQLEIGDLADFVRAKLEAVNQAETDQTGLPID